MHRKHFQTFRHSDSQFLELFVIFVHLGSAYDMELRLDKVMTRNNFKNIIFKNCDVRQTFHLYITKKNE